MATITQHVFTVEGLLPAATFSDLQAVLDSRPTVGEMSKKIDRDAAVNALINVAATVGISTPTILEYLNQDGHTGTNYAALGRLVIQYFNTHT